MDEAERSLRQRVVAEAKTWLNTPYHHHGRVKGSGVDCAQILVAVYGAAGAIKPVDIEHYPPDWHIHRDDERYMGYVTRFATEMPESDPKLPGDLMLVKFGRAFAHSAIIIDWPICIHAIMRSPVCYTDANFDPAFSERNGTRRPRKFFSLRTVRQA